MEVHLVKPALSNVICVLQALGKRLGKSMAAVGNAVKQMNAEQIAEFESKGSISLAGEVLNAGEIKVAFPASLQILFVALYTRIPCSQRGLLQS